MDYTELQQLQPSDIEFSFDATPYKLLSFSDSYYSGNTASASSKIVSGAASTLHEIYTNHDGVRDYNDDVGKSYIQEFVKVISEGANADIQAKSKRKNIKIS